MRLVTVVGKVLRCAGSVFWLVAFLFTCAQPAHAYVDPGSGLLLCQMTGSIFTGVLFLLRRRVRHLFIVLFGSWRRKKPETVAR